MSVFNGSATAEASIQDWRDTLKGDIMAAMETSKDIPIIDPPPDTVSSIAWSSQEDLLAAGSWNDDVRIYQVGASGKSRCNAMYKHMGPALSVCWSKDGTKVFSGGADKVGRMFDVHSEKTSEIAAHDAPIKIVRWIDAQGGILATGSWDKTVKYWDLRQSIPIRTVPLPDRCCAMDIAYPLMVVGCANRKVNMYNMAEPTKEYGSIAPPLDLEPCVVTCFPAADGFALGSSEGRAAIRYVQKHNTYSAANFTFKCHREERYLRQQRHTSVFAVTDISFHPEHGTFSTAGADGAINFWDKEARIRLASHYPALGPISCMAFNRTGAMLAYAVSYDWSMGYTGNVPANPNKIMLHMCKDREVKRRRLVHDNAQTAPPIAANLAAGLWPPT